MYCKKCGGKVEGYASHCPFCGQKLDANDVKSTYSGESHSHGEEARSVGKWLLSFIVTAIPLIGIIMLLIWSFGDKSKSDPTFRNWARAELLLMVIAAVLSFVLTIVVGGSLIGVFFENAPFK